MVTNYQYRRRKGLELRSWQRREEALALFGCAISRPAVDLMSALHWLQRGPRASCSRSCPSCQAYSSCMAYRFLRTHNSYTFRGYCMRSTSLSKKTQLATALFRLPTWRAYGDSASDIDNLASCTSSILSGGYVRSTVFVSNTYA